MAAIPSLALFSRQVFRVILTYTVLVTDSAAVPDNRSARPPSVVPSATVLSW